MKLILNNILKVRSAEIKLGGLTVVTGENDSGKSSIGKMLFSVLKAAKNSRRHDKLFVKGMILGRLRSLERMFGGTEDVPRMLTDIPGLTAALIGGKMTVEELQRVLESESEKRDLPTRSKAIIRHICAVVRRHLARYDNPGLVFMEEFRRIAESEFQEPLLSYGATAGNIHFHDDTADADGSDIDIEITEGRDSAASLRGRTSIDDVTYIESPLYLHILNFLRSNNGLPYHLSDMASKILRPGAVRLDPYQEDHSAQLEAIEQIISGKFEVDESADELAFVHNGHAIPPLSVASGIKSFGVLQRLLFGGNISTSKILIWDEPEIHLHPQWQIEFCKILVELVADGIPVIISSHSPYFIQGLRYFAALKGIEKDVAYYMPVEDAESRLSDFKEVTDDLNRVFTLLASPLHEIMNVASSRNKGK